MASQLPPQLQQRRPLLGRKQHLMRPPLAREATVLVAAVSLLLQSVPR
jgi:hypothetical protein